MMAASRLIHKFGPPFMKRILIILFVCCAMPSIAQFTQGQLAPDFTVQDISGNTRSLYSELDAGRTVILHCFAAWDSYAWEYYQQQTLESFNSLYGPPGSGQLAVWRVECETQNTLSQLQGPASITGNISTDTQGDWLSGSTIPMIDDSAFAAELNLSYVPVLIVICPDRLVRLADQISMGNLANLVFQSACPPVLQGFDPALVSATTSRSCGTNLMNAQLVLKNMGTDTLYSASIEINGAVATQVYQWQGVLFSYQSDTIALENLEVITDDFIYLTLTNQNANYQNDSIRVRSDVGFSSQLVKLELALDAYPEEVSWEIRNESDSVIYFGGEYEVDYQYINHVFLLPASGCYRLFLNDDQGDGLHGSQYGGFDGFCKLYSMADSSTVEEEMFHYDGSYNFSPIENAPSFLQYTFEAGSPLPVAETDRASWKVYPNPAFDWLHIQLTGEDNTTEAILLDLTGRVVSRNKAVQGSSSLQLDVSPLPAGLYMLKLKNELHDVSTPIIIRH